MQRLPDAWVEKLFGRLSGIYGTAFTNKFSNGALNDEGRDIGLENAKAVWAEELGGFRDIGEAIQRALKNIDPKFPPSAREFVELCREAAKAVRDAQKALAYTPTPEEAERYKAMARRAAEAAQARGKADDQRGWAHAMRERYLAGERLLVIQQRLASEALGEDWRDGKCTPKVEAVA